MYWLFVGVISFTILGDQGSTTQLVLNPPWLLVYVVALGAGILGAILAHFLPVGLWRCLWSVSWWALIRLSGWPACSGSRLSGTWMAFIIGGIVGLLLIISAFDWSLYILSSSAGATLVTQAIDLQGHSWNGGVSLPYLCWDGGADSLPKPEQENTAEVTPETAPAKRSNSPTINRISKPILL